MGLLKYFDLIELWVVVGIVTEFPTNRTWVIGANIILIWFGWSIVDVVWSLSSLVSRILILVGWVLLRLVEVVVIRSSLVSIVAVIGRVFPIPLLVVLCWLQVGRNKFMPT